MFTLIMTLYNPYLVSLVAGLSVFVYTKSGKKDDTKSSKQTNLNYVFLTSLIVFILMQYYSNNADTALEPTLDCKFDE